MKTILVDDEILAMEFFQMECQNIEDIEIVGTFESPSEALQYTEKNKVHLAVLDIEMPEIDGIELGKKLREIDPDIILVYISAHDEYAMQAYHLHAPVYLEKPYSREDILFAVATAKKLRKEEPKEVVIRTFGYFDVYVKGKLLYFSNKKSKELFAYLVDRKGGYVSNEQAINILWETAVNDRHYQSKFRRVLKDLRDTLLKEGIDDIVIFKTNARALKTDRVDCDLYDFLDAKHRESTLFDGRYMSEYSWAEDTLGYLIRIWEEEL